MVFTFPDRMTTSFIIFHFIRRLKTRDLRIPYRGTLNPVRANIANTPESSDYTNVQQRIESTKKQPLNRKQKIGTSPPKLSLCLWSNKLATIIPMLLDIH